MVVETPVQREAALCLRGLPSQLGRIAAFAWRPRWIPKAPIVF